MVEQGNLLTKFWFPCVFVVCGCWEEPLFNFACRYMDFLLVLLNHRFLAYVVCVDFIMLQERCWLLMLSCTDLKLLLSFDLLLSLVVYLVIWSICARVSAGLFIISVEKGVLTLVSRGLWLLSYYIKRTCLLKHCETTLRLAAPSRLLTHFPFLFELVCFKLSWGWPHLALLCYV